ncbi:hypothetical protein RZN25_10870 [Bacillaceae bacterium S4-13-56]
MFNRKLMGLLTFSTVMSSVFSLVIIVATILHHNKITELLENSK